MEDTQQRGVLYLIACASSAATELVEPGVRAAQKAGWDVCVITTPKGKNFLNMPHLAQITGHPVRSEYKDPDTPDLLPRPDAVLVYPATFKTINAWASGINDTLAVGLLCEHLGRRTPIVAVPCVTTGSGLDTFPGFLPNMEKLRSWGACILYQPEEYPPKNAIPASIVLAELHRFISKA